MTEPRHRLRKTVILVAPLCFLILLLKVYGQPIRKFFADILTNTRMKAVVTEKFVYQLPSRSDYHDWASERLFDFLEAMQNKHGFPALPSKMKITVYLVDRHADLVRFGPIAEHPDITSNGGYFYPAKWEIAVICLHRSRIDKQTLYHQMTHVLLNVDGPGAEWSPWLEEGMSATYALLDKEGRPGIDPSAAGEIVAALQKGAFIPINEVLTANPTKYAPEPRRVFSHEAHLLVAFLLSTRKDVFRKYYRAERAPGRIEPGLFAKHFGNLETLEEEWKRFIARQAK